MWTEEVRPLKLELRSKRVNFLLLFTINFIFFFFSQINKIELLIIKSSIPSIEPRQKIYVDLEFNPL